MRKEPREPLDRDHLLLFRTLCAPHNLQRAVSQLGMPQATASRSLTKLREAFEDELFTRCSGGLTPTPKALALEPKVAAVIASFEDLFVEETFDPASLVREFRIACADHAMFYFGPAVTLASRTAPGVTFRLSPNGDDWVVELQRGDLDFLNNLATEVGGFRFSRGFSPRGCPRFAVTPTTKSLLTQPLYGKGRNPPPSEPPELALGDPFSGLNDYDTGVKPGCYSG